LSLRDLIDVAVLALDIDGVVRVDHRGINAPLEAMRMIGNTA
jgi:hypothetical protein